MVSEDVMEAHSRRLNSSPVEAQLLAIGDATHRRSYVGSCHEDKPSDACLRN